MKCVCLVLALFPLMVAAGCVQGSVPSQASRVSADAAVANASNHETIFDNFETVTASMRQINHISSQPDASYATQSVPQRTVEIRFPDGTVFRALGAGETAFDALDIEYADSGALSSVSIVGFNAGAVETIKANAALVASITAERINLDSAQIAAWREAKITEIQQATGLARDVATGIVDAIIASVNPASVVGSGD